MSALGTVCGEMMIAAWFPLLRIGYRTKVRSIKRLICSSERSDVEYWSSLGDLKDKERQSGWMMPSLRGRSEEGRSSRRRCCRCSFVPCECSPSVSQAWPSIFSRWEATWAASSLGSIATISPVSLFKHSIKTTTNVLKGCGLLLERWPILADSGPRCSIQSGRVTGSRQIDA